MERTKVACLGDSITKGTYSYNWLDQLATTHDLNDYKFMNFGRNGDLAYNALQRVDDVIAAGPDHIIVLIGTNDVIADISVRSGRYNGLSPKPSPVSFAENLEKIVVKLQQNTAAKIALSTLPVLGEDPDDEANAVLMQYNSEIERIASKYATELIGLNQKMADYLISNPPAEPVPFQKGPGLFAKAAIRRMLFREGWDTISRRYGLLLTTDTVHLNETGGRMLADMVLHCIAGPAGSFFWPRPSAAMYERYRMQFSF